MRYGYGHIPDTDLDRQEDMRHRHVAGLLGPNLSQAIPREVDLRWRTRPMDQGITSSCVGHAFVAAIENTLRCRGPYLTNLSPKAVYDYARLWDSKSGLLFDIGCTPRSAMIGIREYGITTEERWPIYKRADGSTNIDELPPFDVFHASSDALVTGHYRSDDGNIVGALKLALAQQFFPVFGMDVDEAFESYDGSDVYGGPSGNLLGKHMMCLCGYGDGHFLVQNSWGPLWGDGGFARIRQDVFATNAVFDRLVLTAVPTTAR